MSWAVLQGLQKQWVCCVCVCVCVRVLCVCVCVWMGGRDGSLPCNREEPPAEDQSLLTPRLRDRDAGVRFLLVSVLLFLVCLGRPSQLLSSL
jgi:hypothetical protein